MIPWLEAFVAASHQRMLELPSEHPAKRLLTARGVDEATLAAYRIGWIPDLTAITQCTPEFWTWMQRYGWDTILFPLTDPFGLVTGVELRSIHKKDYRDFPVVPKEIVPMAFGLHVALPTIFQTRRAVLVEGIFDYFAVRKCTPEVIAILTSTASLAQRRLLARYAARVVCLFDMDAPGRRGCYKLAGLEVPPQFRTEKDITTRALATPPYLVTFPSYSEHDPNDLWRARKFAELSRLALHGVAPTGAGNTTV